MSGLFTDEQLTEMAARVRAKAAMPPPPSTPPPAPSAPEFAYRARPAYLWNRRAHQSRENFCLEQEPLMPVTEDPEIEDGDVDDSPGEIPKSKVSSTTLCVCNHPKKDHHCTPEPHVADGDCAYYCVTSHCDVFSYRNGVSAPCDCQYFRVSETDALKFTKPRVGPHDLCAACGHFKISHCIKAKPGKVHRLKPGELAYRILQKDDGGSYGCRHFDLENPNCQCDSTGCSATPDGKNFCDCPALKNPWLVRKARVASGKPRNKKPAGASPEVAATPSTSESALASESVKPPRTRKRKLLL